MANRCMFVLVGVVKAHVLFLYKIPSIFYDLIVKFLSNFVDKNMIPYTKCC